MHSLIAAGVLGLALVSNSAVAATCASTSFSQLLYNAASKAPYGSTIYLDQLETTTAHIVESGCVGVFGNALAVAANHQLNLKGTSATAMSTVQYDPTDRNYSGLVKVTWSPSPSPSPSPSANPSPLPNMLVFQYVNFEELGIKFLNMPCGNDPTSKLCDPNGKLRFVQSAFTTSKPVFGSQGQDPLIQTYGVDNVMVSQVAFNRPSPSPSVSGPIGGGAVAIGGGLNPIITTSTFNGYLVNAVTIGETPGCVSASPSPCPSPSTQRESENITIKNNTISRTPGVYGENHGIYVHGFDTLSVTGNTISGFSSCSGTGYGVKVRDGTNATISNNHLNDSGILLYSYDNSSFPFLQNVAVSCNTITRNANLACGQVPAASPSPAPSSESQAGISYWSNAPASSTRELDIHLVYNTLHNSDIRIFSVDDPTQWMIYWNALDPGEGVQNFSNAPNLSAEITPLPSPSPSLPCAP